MDDDQIKVGNIELFHAVRLAASGLSSAHIELDRASETTSKPLIDYLRSGKELTPADRETIAEFLAGEYRKIPGRRPRSKQETERNKEIHAKYRLLMDSGKDSVAGRGSAEFAINMLASVYAPLTREQIEQIVRHRTMRVSQIGRRPRKKTPE